jgi:RND family efflux transporter MFP subunit
MNKKNIWIVLVVVVALIGGGAWYYLHGKPSKATDRPGGPPVSVSTVKAQQRDFQVTLDATGTVTALNNVEIRPQVSSTITKVHIREGQFVKAGQPLFSLDSRTDEVNVTKAKAQLDKDLASLADAKRQLERSKDLFAQNFIAQSAVDTNQSLVDAQAAVVANDRAAIEASRVSLGYNRIVAPSAGRAGAINVFAGSLVQPSGGALVTITQIDPISVSFSLPQRNLNEALLRLKEGKGEVIALLPEGAGTLKGKLQFLDNTVDANSGSVKAKGEFQNADQKLWPGAYVNVKMVVQTIPNAILIPQAAVIQGVGGDIVYVVDEENKAVMRKVQVLQSAQGEAVVKGVNVGERVVVDGKQNLRPGATAVEKAASGPGGAASGARKGGGAGKPASAVAP